MEVNAEQHDPYRERQRAREPGSGDAQRMSRAPPRDQYRREHCIRLVRLFIASLPTQDLLGGKILGHRGDLTLGEVLTEAMHDFAFAQLTGELVQF